MNEYNEETYVAQGHCKGCGRQFGNGTRVVDYEDNSAEWCLACWDNRGGWERYSPGIGAVETDTDETDEDETEPQEDDIVCQPSGYLGSQTSVGVVNGKFIGVFSDEDEVDAAIKAYMDQHQFWPTVWNVSDHGNATLRDVK